MTNQCSFSFVFFSNFSGVVKIFFFLFLKAATTATSLLSCGIGRDGGDILCSIRGNEGGKKE